MKRIFAIKKENGQLRDSKYKDWYDTFDSSNINITSPGIPGGILLIGDKQKIHKDIAQITTLESIKKILLSLALTADNKRNLSSIMAVDEDLGNQIRYTHGIVNGDYVVSGDGKRLKYSKEYLRYPVVDGQNVKYIAKYGPADYLIPTNIPDQYPITSVSIEL